jgi:hypothetical protein
MDQGYKRDGWNGLALHRETVVRSLAGSKTGQPAATAQILFDTQLLGYRLEDVWSFVRSSERDRATRLDLSGFMLRQGRRVIRVLEGSGEVMEKARDEILFEERELEHARSVYLGSWLPNAPLFKENALQIIEPDEETFRDLLSLRAPGSESEPLEPEALCYLIDRMYLKDRATRLPI